MKSEKQSRLKKPRRTFSIRIALFAIAVIAIGFAYASHLRSRVHRHHRTISTLREKGFPVETIKWAPELSTPTEKMFSDFGLSPWVSVVFVDFRASEVQEAEIQEVISSLKFLVPRDENRKPALKLRDDLPVDFVVELSEALPNCRIEYQNKKDWTRPDVPAVNVETSTDTVRRDRWRE